MVDGSEELLEWITASEKLLKEMKGEKAVYDEINDALNSTYRQLYITHVEGKKVFVLTTQDIPISIMHDFN